MLSEIVTKAFWEITAGNLISVLGCVAALFVGWQKLVDRVDSVKEKLELHQGKFDDLADSGVPTVCKIHTERLSAIEEQLRQIPVIANDVSWIKRNLEKNGHSHNHE